MPRARKSEERRLNRRAWLWRCLRRDALLLALWGACLIAAWCAINSHAGVWVLHKMLAPSAGPGGGGSGIQLIFLKDGHLSEDPGPVPVQGARVAWRCYTVALGDPDHPFYEEANFGIGVLTPLAPEVTEADIRAHVHAHGIWLPLGGEAARLLGDGSLEEHPRLHRDAHVIREYPRHVIAGIRASWPHSYEIAWAAAIVGLTAILGSSRSFRVWRRWQAGRCTRCAYDVLGAEICPECGLVR